MIIYSRLQYALTNICFSCTVPAMSVNCATALISILSATALRFVLVRLNRKLDYGYGGSEASQRGFRYLV